MWWNFSFQNRRKTDFPIGWLFSVVLCCHHQMQTAGKHELGHPPQGQNTNCLHEWQWQPEFLFPVSGTWFNMTRRNQLYSDKWRESFQNFNLASIQGKDCLSLVESCSFISVPVTHMPSWLDFLRPNERWLEGSCFSSGQCNYEIRSSHGVCLAWGPKLSSENTESLHFSRRGKAPI